jgi:hypothetical protein
MAKKAGVRSLCFVLMPFGQKPGAGNVMIDFDAVYKKVIKPAIEAVGLEPLRADEEVAGGIIHKPMFERLVLCEYAVADLTSANANVFYELGVRHAVRPWSTISIFAATGTRLPFDVAPLRASSYKLGKDGTPSAAKTDAAALATRLRAARDAVTDGSATDSPLFQMLKGYPKTKRSDTDVFRKSVDDAAQLKADLAQARGRGLAAVKAIGQQVQNSEDEIEAGVAIDLLDAYRANEGFKEMIALVETLPKPIAGMTMAQEQYALALNRTGSGGKAEQVLQTLIKERGPSSETYGILGRVRKDRWKAASDKGKNDLAAGLLDGAIDAYLKGFETDWRDYHPGVNAVTLMTLRDPPDPRRETLLPVVAYAVERKIAGGKPGYWEMASRLELAILARDQPAVRTALQAALAQQSDAFSRNTTANNLTLISEAWKRRKQPQAWLDAVIAALRAK